MTWWHPLRHQVIHRRSQLPPPQLLELPPPQLLELPLLQLLQLLDPESLPLDQLLDPESVQPLPLDQLPPARCRDRLRTCRFRRCCGDSVAARTIATMISTGTITNIAIPMMTMTPAKTVTINSLMDPPLSAWCVDTEGRTTPLQSPFNRPAPPADESAGSAAAPATTATATSTAATAAATATTIAAGGVPEIAAAAVAASAASLAHATDSGRPTSAPGGLTRPPPGSALSGPRGRPEHRALATDIADTADQNHPGDGEQRKTGHE
ncbi:hypothetical protein ACFWM1_06860 [Nocardia sp. NPDC058379]|uniref:hypothetical protein n=1 Tax=unclassified Nocardia TaxID=2637762 RepID=UPI003665EA96